MSHVRDLPVSDNSEYCTSVTLVMVNYDRDKNVNFQYGNLGGAKYEKCEMSEDQVLV